MNARTYRLVLADDVGSLRKLFRIALERSQRFRVVGEAANGHEAVEAAMQHHPDAVLLDLSMPQMDGLEALPHILELSPQTKVIVLSGFNEDRMGPVAKRLGAVGYLEKGLEPQALVENVLGLLEPAPSGRAVEVPPSRGHFRVIYAGDDPQVSRLLEEGLERAHAQHRLQVEPSLPDVVEMIRGEAPDLVALDLHEAITASQLTDLLTSAAQVPVIAFVDDPTSPLASLAHKMGVEDCLPRDRAGPDLVERSIRYASERRRGQEARRTAREKAEELDRLREVERLKTDFFNTAAHELATPLTPIKLQLHLLRSSGSNFNESQRRAFEILSRNVDRMGRLSQDLLDVARLQAGQLRLTRQRVDVQKLAQEVVETFEPVAVAQGLELQLAPSGAAWVLGDPKRLGQVFYNLVSNAIKFTRQGGRIDVEIVPTDEEVLVLVHDSGVGLTADQIARLFRPFSQVQGHLQPAGMGTGLGLYICKGIVDLHQGRIWCESSGPMRGATFAFAVPAAARTSHATQAPAPAAAGGEAPVWDARDTARATFTHPYPWNYPDDSPTPVP